MRNYDMIKHVSEPLTEEELKIENEYVEQMEEAHQKYSTLVKLYQQIIQLEIDYERKLILEGCLEELNEENK